MGNPDTDVGDEPVQQTQQSRPTSWLRFLIVGYPVCGFMLLYLNQPKYYFDLTQQEHGYNITVLEPGSCADYQLITFLVKMGLVLMSAVILVVAGRLLALLTSLSSTDPRWIVRAGSYSIRGLIACAVLILAIPIPWFLNASVAHVGYDQDTFTALVSRNLRVYPDADKALAGGILDNEKLQDGCDGTIAGQLWCNTPDTHENHEARWATNVRGFERVYAEIESARNIDAANACRKDRNWIWSTNVLKCKEVLEHRPAELEYGNVIIVTNLTQMPTLLSVGLRRPEVEQLPLDWPSEIQFFTNASLGRPPPVLGQNLGLISHLENLQMNWYPKPFYPRHSQLPGSATCGLWISLAGCSYTRSVPLFFSLGSFLQPGCGSAGEPTKRIPNLPSPLKSTDGGVCIKLCHGRQGKVCSF
ncbi:hypothetical protein K461DRAFT_151937 [Myriangium duriaei CBS 260.36]|uniref:Transmembrane protein n=1 Tax=Myriangium duriaei CBS 260.36 TaxID=1168546 RepID=A0A9P4J015_9PEZI|nr:hypothetical protein K461DRAFT_151937 [Myriangium duriaei CBS 260.36]